MVGKGFFFFFCKKQNFPYSFIPQYCQEVGIIIVKNCADQENAGMQSNWTLVLKQWNTNNECTIQSLLLLHGISFDDQFLE